MKSKELGTPPLNDVLMAELQSLLDEEMPMAGAQDRVTDPEGNRPVFPEQADDSQFPPSLAVTQHFLSRQSALTAEFLSMLPDNLFIFC